MITSPAPWFDIFNFLVRHIMFNCDLYEFGNDGESAGNYGAHAPATHYD